MWNANRTAYTSSEVICDLVRLDVRAIGCRVKKLILEVLVHGAVERVRPTLGNGRDLTGLAVLRIIINAVYAYLGDRGRRGEGVRLDVIAGLILRRDPIHGRFGLRGQAALNREFQVGSRMRRGLWRTARGIGLYTGQRLNDVQRRGRTCASVVRRQIEHSFGRERGGNGGVVSVDCPCVRGIHSDAGRAHDGKRHVVAQLLAGVQMEIVGGCRSKASGLGTQVIGAWIEIEGCVLAVRTCGDAAIGVAFCAMKGDGCVRNKGSLWVMYGTGDGTERRLPGCCEAGAEKEEKKQESACKHGVTSREVT